MQAKMNYSNLGVFYILKKNSLNRLLGGIIFLMGADLSTSSLRSIHSRCFSVSKSLPPILSFSVLKFVTTTPMNKFKKKKKPTIKNNMQKKLQKGDLDVTAEQLMSPAVIENIKISYQPAVVDITKRVIMALGMSSKVQMLLIHSPPAERHSHFELTSP